jgi:superfamily II DNA/RNA helicase
MAVTCAKSRTRERHIATEALLRGTGKTSAFLLPALFTRLTTENLLLQHVRLLVLAPTESLRSRSPTSATNSLP